MNGPFSMLARLTNHHAMRKIQKGQYADVHGPSGCAQLNSGATNSISVQANPTIIRQPITSIVLIPKDSCLISALVKSCGSTADTNMAYRVMVSTRNGS